MSNAPLILLDTTLRDGDQAAGCAMTLETKLALAASLDALGVDIIEAGFPASSAYDFECVSAVASQTRHAAVSALARLSAPDIVKAAQALQGAARKVIHLTVPVSPVLRQARFQKTDEEILSLISRMVKLAAQTGALVELGAEDAARADIPFLCQVYHTALSAGATTVNFADTAGILLPHEVTAAISALISALPALKEQGRLSVHFHNDRGLALANTLAALMAGATQAEVTLGGLGERAGNTSLEELTTLLATAPAGLPAIASSLRPDTILDTAMIFAGLTGVTPRLHQAVTGPLACHHAAGMHQSGLTSNPGSYQTLPGQTFHLMLSRHSGIQGVQTAAQLLAGVTLDDETARTLTSAVKELSSARPCLPDWQFLELLQETADSTLVIYKPYHVHTQSLLDRHSVRVTLQSSTRGLVSASARGQEPLYTTALATLQAVGSGYHLISAAQSVLSGPGVSRGHTVVTAGLGNRQATGFSFLPPTPEATAEAALNAAIRLNACLREVS